MLYNFRPDEVTIQYWPPTNTGFGPHRIPKGVKIIHLPTGSVVISVEERNHFLNREKALGILWSQVKDLPTYAEAITMLHIYKTGLENALHGEPLDMHGNRDENGLLRGYQTRYGISELNTAINRIKLMEQEILRRTEA